MQVDGANTPCKRPREEEDKKEEVPCKIRDLRYRRGDLSTALACLDPGHAPTHKETINDVLLKLQRCDLHQITQEYWELVIRASEADQCEPSGLVDPKMWGTIGSQEWGDPLGVVLDDPHTAARVPVSCVAAFRNAVKQRHLTTWEQVSLILVNRGLLGQGESGTLTILASTCQVAYQEIVTGRAQHHERLWEYFYEAMRGYLRTMNFGPNDSVDYQRSHIVGSLSHMHLSDLQCTRWFFADLQTFAVASHWTGYLLDRLFTETTSLMEGCMVIDPVTFQFSTSKACFDAEVILRDCAVPPSMFYGTEEGAVYMNTLTDVLLAWYNLGVSNDTEQLFNGSRLVLVELAQHQIMTRQKNLSMAHGLIVALWPRERHNWLPVSLSLYTLPPRIMRAEYAKMMLGVHAGAHADIQSTRVAIRGNLEMSGVPAEVYADLLESAN